MAAAVIMATPRCATALVDCLKEAIYRHVTTTTKYASQKSRNWAARAPQHTTLVELLSQTKFIKTIKGNEKQNKKPKKTMNHVFQYNLTRTFCNWTQTIADNTMERKIEIKYQWSHTATPMVTVECFSRYLASKFFWGHMKAIFIIDFELMATVYWEGEEPLKSFNSQFSTGWEGDLTLKGRRVWTYGPIHNLYGLPQVQKSYFIY